MNKTASMNIDWALVKSPFIHNGLLDLEFLFDIGPDQSQCDLPPDMHDYFF
jgi:hypothetical protein